MLTIEKSALLPVVGGSDDPGPLKLAAGIGTGVGAARVATAAGGLARVAAAMAMPVYAGLATGFTASAMAGVAVGTALYSIPSVQGGIAFAIDGIFGTYDDLAKFSSDGK